MTGYGWMASVLIVVGLAFVCRSWMKARTSGTLGPRERFHLAVALVALMAFFGLGLGLETAPVQALDRTLHEPTGLVRNHRLIPVVGVVTILGDWRVLLPLVGLVGLSVGSGWERFLARWGGAFAGTSLSVLSLKRVFDRDRPVDRLVTCLDPSFPSGHAAIGLAFWAILAVALIRSHPGRRSFWLAVCLGLAGVVGITRLLLRVHWPTDIVGGWLLALFWLNTAAAGARPGDGQPENRGL